MLRKLLVAATAIGLASGVQAQDQNDLLSKSWDDIVAQAKDEGSVNWFVWYSSRATGNWPRPSPPNTASR